MPLQPLNAWTPSPQYREDSFRSRWARHLHCAMFKATTAIRVDDNVVLGLFSRMTTKPVNRRFFPALFSQNKPPIDLEAIRKFREITNKYQPALFNPEPTVAALRTETGALTVELLNWGSDIMSLSDDDSGHEALLWALQVYRGLISPWSPVKLKVLSLGITAEPGFGVVARRAFSTGEYIFELIGLLTTDYVEEHTALSTITCPRHQTRHIFWGPIRMYVEVTGQRAMVACALRNIKIGEELVFDYGREFWEGSCPCKTCNMAQSSTPLVVQQQTPITAVPIVPATEVEQLERQRMRAEKAERERQRKNKRSATYASGLRDYRLRSRFDVGRIPVEWQVVAA
ncbi:hypothetical protein B0H13DRAFT_1864705 [Mycena leptocephala]|nr:hypothetical protein B0H13DRAFT_1864705 [Mycena leptocephala]